MGLENKYSEMEENGKSTNCVDGDVKELKFSDNDDEVGGNERMEQYENYKNSEKTKNGAEFEKMLPDFEDMFKDMPLTKDTTCGFWLFKGPFLQK